VAGEGDTGTRDRKWVHDIFRDGLYVGFIGLPSSVTVLAVTAELIIAVEKDENDVSSLLVLSLTPPSPRQGPASLQCQMCCGACTSSTP